MRRSSSVFVVVALVAGMFVTNAAAGVGRSAVEQCDPGYVIVEGRVVTVLPTGVDDTANLQCAFDVGVEMRRGAVVRLVDGTYVTAQLIVSGFEGTFSGSGAGRTIVENLPHLVVTVEDLASAPPSADNSWPSLIALIGGEVTVRNMTIRAVGEHPTSGWEIFGLQLTELAHLIVVLGDEADLAMYNTTIAGETAPEALFGYNVINGVYAEGLIAGFPAQSGSMTVSDSAFSHVGSAVPLSAMDGYRMRVTRTTFDDVFSATEVVDVRNTSIVFSRNRIDAFVAVDIYDGGYFDIGVEDSDISIKDNVIAGTYGVFVEPTFGDNVQCRVLSNDVAGVDDIGIFLGEGTYGCTVVLAGWDDIVVDLGTDNVIIGPHHRQRATATDDRLEAARGWRSQG